MKYVFWGLVIVVAALFLASFVSMGNYLLAALSFGLGVMWLAADAKIESYMGTLFFLAFVMLAVIASLNEALTPLALLGMCANLAAWDISRFRARLAGETNHDTRAILASRHLRLLAVIICVGFLIALLPLAFRLPLPFVIVVGVVLLALLALQQSIRSLGTTSD